MWAMMTRDFSVTKPQSLQIWKQFIWSKIVFRMKRPSRDYLVLVFNPNVPPAELLCILRKRLEPIADVGRRRPWTELRRALVPTGGLGGLAVLPLLVSALQGQIAAGTTVLVLERHVLRQGAGGVR